MKAKITCACALVLPLPVYTFVAFSSVPLQATTHIHHQVAQPTHVAHPYRRSRPSASSTEVRMTQAIDLSSALGAGEATAPVDTYQGKPSNPVLDRSNLGFHLKIGSKVMNLYGLLFATQAWLTALLMFPLCLLSAVVSPIFDWGRMRPPTLVALLWGRLALWNMGVRPKVEGVELLPPKEEAVVFVANHASYLDIPVTNFLPRMCKYLMKAELLWLPIVGWKAVLAKDIFVHRQTSATFRQLLRVTTRSLKKGNSIMTFPEGTRSRDGRLGQFKRGPFTMAQQAGARVVPVTITGVTEAMPPFAMAPLRKPRNVRLVIHPAISTKDRPIREVMKEARKAVGDGLEDWQKPKPRASATDLSPASPPPSTPTPSPQ
ncbi:unnamed protein product [Scytosiphon promiscuus]